MSAAKVESESVGLAKPSVLTSKGSVSVCLLTYNHAAILEETVKSILDQSLPEFEFIISDDCSTDGTWEVVQKLARQYATIRPLRTPRNLGMCGNANFAVSQSAGDYIALVHHDDIYRADMLERWLDVMKRHEEVAFVFNDCARQRPDGSLRLSHQSEGRNYPERITGRWLLENDLLTRWGCSVRGTAMIRRSCWEAVGGMCPEFGMIADVDLWMRLAERWDVGYVEEPLILVRHQRPDHYPVEYREFSWRRWKLLYSIHAANLIKHYGKSGVRFWWKWMEFRTRVSWETCKWLTYALVRKRNEMIRDSKDGECAWEYPPVKWYRNCVKWGEKLGIIMNRRERSSYGGS